MTDKEKKTGVVLWFNERRGFGFIESDDGGKDMFAHYTNIVSDSKFKTLVSGQRVSFVVGANKNGPQAEEITLIEG